MALFLRKWKSYKKHKKLSEEWALATSLKDFSEIQDTCEEDDLKSFDLKYLGHTTMNSERSKNDTTKAIKSVISTAKNNKQKSQNVKLNVSSKGIEMIDQTSGDALLRVSIYKISYCSADAVHDRVFSFIESEDKPFDDGDENLTCHAYLCPKRKIAHDVTMTVARSFENAYQSWRHTVECKQLQQPRVQKRSGSECSQSESCSSSERESEKSEDVLIDFAQDAQKDIYNVDHRQYLQNTWVCFDDDTKNDDSWGECEILHNATVY